MNHAKEVEDFVHKSFAMYGLKFDSFFNELVDEREDEDGVPYGGELVALPIAIGSEIDMDLLGKAATTIGVTTDALLNMDEQAVGIWCQKYPYFELKRQFDAIRKYSRHFAGLPEDMIVASIFDENYHPNQFKRYSWSNIKTRLLDLLKKYSSVIPECYHENANIKELVTRTDNFTSFAKIKDLTESYLVMVERARELFYKLWDVKLPDDEIREYNLLVSVLGMRDAAFSPRPIYYELARKFAPVYKQEGFKEYSSYIRYKDRDLPAFWTCKEFYDYPDLITRVIREFPEVKSEMGQMAILAKNICCAYAWSDEEFPDLCVSPEEYLASLLWDLNLASEYEPVYGGSVFVPKTEEEIGGDALYIARCKQLAAPASKGGLVLPTPEIERGSSDNDGRALARILRMSHSLEGNRNG